MTLQQLEYIVALDHFRHYVNAANHCFISQPNLTMQIKKLEEDLGVTIFNRNKKPVEPTEVGKEIILRAKKILRECKLLKEFVKDEKESLQGEYTIGIIPTLAPYLLPLFLPQFLKENPQIFLKIKELQTGQIISQIEEGTLDLGLLVTPLNESSISEVPLFYEPFLVYVPLKHKLLNEKLMMAEDLDPSEILVLDEGHCFRDQALAICKTAKHDSSLGFNYQSGSIEALKSLVKKGIGYTLVPELSVIKDIEYSQIRRFSVPEPVREVSIVTHNSFIKMSLIELLKKNIQQAVPKSYLKPQDIVPFS